MKTYFKRIMALILAVNMLFTMLPVQAFATDGTTQATDWSSASVVFVGDSITYGSGTDKTYHEYIKEKGIFESVQAMGVGGSCISSQSDYGQGNSPLVSRYSSIPKSDLIVIFMGTNDYGHETPVGNISDSTDVSFYGALNVVVSGLQNKYPDSQLVFVTPLHRYGFGTSKILETQFTYDNIANGNGHTLKDYVDAIKNICQKYSLDVIDLFNECSIDPTDSEQRTAYIPDGLHPNADGHKIVADLIARNLQKIERKYTDNSENTENTDQANGLVLKYGNKFVANYVDDSTRASSKTNFYLEKGTTVTFEKPEDYEWALAKTTGENTETYSRYYPENGWNKVSAYTVGESGYYGLVLKKTDGTAFDFNGADSSDIFAYITVSEGKNDQTEHSHTHTAVTTAPTCTQQGYTTYTCECGDSYVAEYTEKTNHSFENGVCLNCGYSYAGKTVSILSHSISTYEGVSNNPEYNSTLTGGDIYYTAGRHDVYQKDTWWQQAIDALGMRLLVNNSWSGSCIYQPRRGAASVGYGDRAVNLHNDHTGEEPDVIWVYLGGNDFAYYKETFGKASDVDYTALIKADGNGGFTYATPTTTCEAYAIMLHKISQRYPDSEVYCMTSTSRRDPDYPDNYADTGQPTEYVAQLWAVAEYFGMPVVDLESCIPKEAEQFDKYMGDKRAHPNALGMDKITDELLSVILGNTTEICHVTSDGLVKEQAVLSGGKYSTDIEIKDGYSVTVTMAGKDITATAYKNGKVTIDNVTGDIEIKAGMRESQLNFRWEIQNGKLTSVGETENQMELLSGNITDTTLNSTIYELTEAVTLKHNSDWIVEWKCAGNWRGVIFATDTNPTTVGKTFISRVKGGQMCIGTYSGSQYNNYGVDISYLDDQTHIYKLVNKVSADGSNMVWLYVDGAEIGPMNNYYIGSNDQKSTSDWVSGKDFVLPYTGMEKHAINNCQLEYLQVWEGGETAEKLSLRYDDHYDITGKTVEIVDAGAPTSYQVGYGVAENTVADTAVVTLKDANTLVATGTGVAKVRIDGVLYEITVTPAPISLLLLIGQSNMEGNEGEAKQSIVCPDGMVYATYGDRYDMVLSNATHYAPSALTGQYREINAAGGTDGLSDYPVYMLTDEGNGRKGPDSGFAYEWVKQTGEKVWIVNASHGGTSLDVWQPGTTQYEECQAMFGACQDTLRKEIAAGHFTLSHMAYFWCQGCNDSTQTAQWYVDKYMSMHNALNEEMAFDHDGNPATAAKEFEFAGIIPVRTSHEWRLTYREGTDLNTTTASYYESFKDLRMSGPRVAQYWMVNNPELKDIVLVCNIGEDWVWMPDGTNGVSKYFNEHYENGTVDYETQVKQSASWYKPTTPAAVHDSIHYNQIGYNEVGRESVRNILIYMGINPDYEQETTVKFVDWTGYNQVDEITASTAKQSSTLVVPMVSPVTRTKDVTYTLSDGLSYNYYDLVAESVNQTGTMTATGAQGSVAVTPRNLESYTWSFDGANLTSNPVDGDMDNPLTLVAGSVDDGVFNGIRYKLAQSIYLNHDSEWGVEIKISGWNASSGIMVLSGGSAASSGQPFVYFRPADYFVGIGYYDGGQYNNYGVSLKNYGISFAGDSHTYRLVNKIADDGNNTIWLYVDDEEIAPLTEYYANSTLKDSENNGLSGKDFVLSFVGTSDFAVKGCTIDAIRVEEKEYSPSGHLHTWSVWVSETQPSAKGPGTDKRSCKECGLEQTREVEGVWQKYELDKHMVDLPEEYCAGTNLWSVLTHDKQYYHSGQRWDVNGNVHSVTFAVNGGEQIFATSFGKAGTNGSTANGIRVTFFGPDGVLKTMSPAETYNEFVANGGYIVAPEGALAVNVPMYNNSDANQLFILNKAHTYSAETTAPTCTEQGYTTYTCDCGDSYVADYTATDEHSFSQWVMTVAPTFTEDGKESRECDKCRHVEVRDLKLAVVMTGNMGPTAQPDKVTCTLYNNGTLVLEGTGIIYGGKWNGENQPYSQYRHLIKEVIIGEGITATSGGCFAYLYNLEKVTFPSTLKKLENNAFMSAFTVGTTQLTIPATITYLGSYAFGHYGGENSAYFTDIIIENPDIDFRDEKAVFNGGSNLNTLTLYSHGDGNNVSAYAEKYGIDYINIDNYKTGKYGDVEYKLSSGVLTLSALAEKAQVTAGTAPWDEYSTQVQQIVIKDGIIGIGADAFVNYPVLEAVSLPDGIVSIGDGAFAVTDGKSVPMGIKIPKRTEKIGKDIFEGRCRVNLTTYYGSAAAEIGTDCVKFNLKKQFKLLFIGNSYSEDASNGTHTTGSQTFDLIKSMLGEDAEIVVGLCSSGGKGMHWHATQAEQGNKVYSFKVITSESGKWVSQGTYTSADALAWTDWDAVSLQPYNINVSTGQESVPYPDTTDEKFYPIETASEFMLDYVDKYAPQAKIYFYMHWAQTKSTVLNAVLSSYNKMAAYMPTVLNFEGTESGRKFETIVPVGLSIQNARTTYLATLAYNTSAYDDGNLNLTTDAQIGLQRDGGHVSFNIGRYIAGLTFAEMVVPQSMRADGYTLTPIRKTESVGTLPAEYTEIAQKSVHAAVNSWKNGSLAVTTIDGYQNNPLVTAKAQLENSTLAVGCTKDNDGQIAKLTEALYEKLPADCVVKAVEINGDTATATVGHGYTTETVTVKFTTADHSYGNWTQVTAPTCDAEGKDKQVCTNCGSENYRDTRISGDENKILVSNPIDKSQLAGKRLLLIGDSITAGVGTTKTYGAFLAESLGVTVTNKGVSGSGYCSGGAMATNKTLTEANVRNADIITIMLGINDFNWSVKDGSWNGNPSYYDKSKTYYQLGDFDSTDTSTFYGALHSWCQKIVEMKKIAGFEEKQFIVITPMISSWNASTGKKTWDQDKLNIHGHTLRQYCTAIMEVCAYYDIPVFDANMFSGLYYNGPEDNNVDIAGGDGVHVNEAGHQLLANSLAEFLLEGYSYEARKVEKGGHNYVNGRCEECRLTKPAPVITKQPVDAKVNIGQYFKITVEAEGTGLKYQWYYKDKGMADFAPSSVKKATYSFELVSFRVGRQYYCEITDAYGNVVTTDIVKSTTDLAILAQPQDVQVEIGEKATISVSAVGEGLKYQWYYKDKGMADFAVSGNKTAKYSYPMTTYRNGRQVYCVITDANDNSVTTQTATMAKPPVELAIVAQPQDVQVEIGQKATISVSAMGDGLKYQWYYKDKGMADFAVSGNKTAKYSYPMTTYRNGRQVYCVISDQYGNTVTTQTATMTKPPVKLAITGQPTDVMAQLNEKFTVAVTAQGDGLKYQWYYKDTYMKDFAISSNKTAKYSYPMTTYRNGRQVYCVITDQYGETITTQTATIILK